jgi:predicted nucleic acid-binding protein
VCWRVCAEHWKAAAAAGQLIGCPIVTLELLHAAPDADRLEAVASALAGLRQAPITRTVTDAAISAVRELALRGAPGAHRVRVPDALIAAAAADRGLPVLHLDHHFDRLATVLGFRSQWIAASGSIP